MPFIQLSQEQPFVRDITFLTTIANSIPRLITELASIPPDQIESESTCELIGKKIGHPAQDVGRAIKVLGRILTLKENGERPVDVLIGDLLKSIDQTAISDGARANLSRWESVRDSVVNAVESIPETHPLQVSRRITSVLFSQQNTLTEANVATEFRPVFDESGEKILHGIIVHRLLIHFQADGKKGKIEFALDARDLASLRRVCQQAERRAIVLKDGLKGVSWKTSIAQAEIE